MNNLLTLLGLGMDMGANFDNLSMAQKRTALGNMFDPMEAGRERLRAMTAPETVPGEINPFMVQGLLDTLRPQQPPAFFDVPAQQVTPTQQIPVVPQMNFYRGLL